MELKICAVRDVKSEAYGAPIVTQSVGVAIRSFDDEVNRKDERNDMYNHSEDFTLYLLGTFDNVTGEIKSHPPKVLIAADQVRKSEMLGKVSKV